MNVNLYVIEDYRKNDDFIVRINKPNLVRCRRIPKMNVNAFLQKDYENETTSGPKKQTQTNPILSAVGGFQNELKIACQKIRPHPKIARQFHNRIGQYYKIRVEHYFLAGLWMQAD